MAGVNKVILLGRLGAEVEAKNTPTGKMVANFSVATSQNWKDKNGKKQEKTEWTRVVVWGKLAEIASKYLKKGSQVYLEGRLQTRSWEDSEGVKKYTTEVIASTLQFVGSVGGGSSRSEEKPEKASDSADDLDGFDFDDDSLDESLDDLFED